MLGLAVADGPLVQPVRGLAAARHRTPTVRNVTRLSFLHNANLKIGPVRPVRPVAAYAVHGRTDCSTRPERQPDGGSSDNDRQVLRS